MSYAGLRPGVYLAFLFLIGCATPGPAPPPDFHDLQQQLLGLQSWRVEGKIGLRREGKGNSALLSWQQNADHYKIRLSGPLGIGTVTIEGDDTGVEVRNKQGVFHAPSPEQLMLEQTGWQIPLSQLRYWARGLPAADLPLYDERIEAGRLQQLVQGGWDIEYRDYQRVDDLWLPSRITLSRAETTLTLLLKRWQLDGEP